MFVLRCFCFFKFLLKTSTQKTVCTAVCVFVFYSSSSSTSLISPTELSSQCIIKKNALFCLISGQMHEATVMPCPCPHCPLQGTPARGIFKHACASLLLNGSANELLSGFSTSQLFCTLRSDSWSPGADASALIRQPHLLERKKKILLPSYRKVTCLF